MSILVSGGNGFIGSNFIEHLLEVSSAPNIINVDKRTSISSDWVSNEYRNSGYYSEYKLDINKISDLSRIDSVDIEEITHCVHFAAESHVDLSLGDIKPFIDSNITGTTAVANFCFKHRIKMIHISTDEVYGHITKGKTFKFKAGDPLKPRNPYSASKASAEMMLSAFKNVNPDFEYCIVRPANQYGPRQDDTKFIPKLIKGLYDGTPFPMYGDGLFYREWTYVRDTCEIIRQIMDTDMRTPGVFNITSNVLLSNMEVFIKIFAIAKECNTDAEQKIKGVVEFIHDPRGNAHDNMYAIANKPWVEERMIKAIGFEQRIKEMLNERS